jgi:hypothetical protein
MLRYWASVFIEANKLAWNRLFGSLFRALTDLAIWWAAVVVLRFYFGRGHQMSDQVTWAEAIGIAAAGIYLPTLVLYLFRVPFLRDKQTGIEIKRLKALAGEATGAASFDIGFEVRDIDERELLYGYHSQDVVRIWIENLTERAIEDCRAIIDDLTPDSGIKRGAMLIADNRRDEDERSAKFTLAATERRYFKFVSLTNGLGRNSKPRLEIESDQKGTGWYDFFRGRTSLDRGQRYLATIAVHGAKASSRRMDLAIEIGETEIRVYENHSPAQETLTTVS